MGTSARVETQAMLSVEDEGHVRHLVLDRPEKRNALNGELMLALRDAAREASDDPDVRCVVLRGAGPCFSAGVDVFELGEHGRPELECCARSGACASRPPTRSRR